MEDQTTVQRPITYQPIGVIRSPFKTIKNMPIQPTGASGVPGEIQIFDRYAAGLKDLDGFSHLILIYHFHLVQGYHLQVTPFLDQVERGLFATRAPKRPNAVGLSIVRLLSVTGNTLEVIDLDIVDGTPLLDLKPYVPQFDAHGEARIGWMADRLERLDLVRSDDRFR